MFTDWTFANGGHKTRDHEGDSALALVLAQNISGLLSLKGFSFKLQFHHL